MFTMVRRLVFELGTGRAAENACRERQQLELINARLDALARRVAEPPVPESDTAAA